MNNFEKAKSNIAFMLTDSAFLKTDEEFAKIALEAQHLLDSDLPVGQYSQAQ